ncbi:T9SS type B sorting domain-containing protein [Nonlabens sp. SY33080]|uniref:T9SS type B sorting domain-containing protein n=1 Tax=Nonlabens sp. SY33080 TaxID=2719911 RepID=UPI001428C8EB|nr:T9SS type B sorting domain-containing protein [Nonlabens sp. SY33080]
MKRIAVTLLVLFYFAFAKAQLSFCDGEIGPTIFTETFGSGTTNGPALPANVTTYTYVNSGIQDGEYTISSNMQQLSSFWDAPDHTGDPNGKMLLVNADFTAGLFYQTPITGLCENTPYEFSAWVINILDNNNPCGAGEIPIQVRFEIWDITDSTLLASGAMPPESSQPAPTWKQYGLTFTTATGQNGCILKLINEGAGGCGNDLAIDDIVFRTCGDTTQIIDAANNTVVTKCEDDPAQSITLSASTVSSIFTTPEYQWQQSDDGVIFTDILGQNGPTFTTPNLNDTIFYRVKVAEDAVNLSNSQCVNFSDVFEFRDVTVPQAVPVQNPVIACDGISEEMEVTLPNGTTAFWYTVPTGGTSIHDVSNDYTTNIPGTYYVETVDIQSGCVSNSRVAIDFLAFNSPNVTSQDYEICPDETVVLDPQFSPASYVWSTGEGTPTIDVDTEGIYTVEVINNDGCSSTATFTVTITEAPIIDEIIVIGNDLQVTLSNTDLSNFQYSIDGLRWSDLPNFDITTFTQVTVFVRDRLNCTVVQQEYNRIIIPQFFTPNQDGFNDYFNFEGLRNFPDARLQIFDRHGKLIKEINDIAVRVGWDGTYNGQPLPSSDYWFKLDYDNKSITGHFSLIR